MAYRGAIGASVLVAALLMTAAPSRAFDETKYPDLKGQWRRGPNADIAGVLPGRVNTFDPTKGWGPAQQAPLTPEYQARFEANLANQAAGGQGIGDLHLCVARHAARHQRVWTDRICRDAGGNAHSRRKYSGLAADLHRRPRLAEGNHAVPHRLFDRSMDRCRWRRQIRRAGSRDARLQGPASVRRERNSAARRQSDHRQGTNLPRQE